MRDGVTAKDEFLDLCESAYAELYDCGRSALFLYINMLEMGYGKVFPGLPGMKAKLEKALAQNVLDGVGDRGKHED